MTVSDLTQRADGTRLPLERHMRRRLIEFGESLSQRVAIYLDVCFWIRLRDSELGVTHDEKCRELLRCLRETVAGGIAYCPISDNLFVELLKQTDRASRGATAALIDELGLGACLIPSDTRIGTEIAHVIHANLGVAEVYPLKHLVWSKTSFALGFFQPNFPSMTADDGLRLQISFFDFVWDTVSLEKVMEYADISGRSEESIWARGLARRLNEGIQEHATELRSFADTYEMEAAGVADLYADRMLDIVHAAMPKDIAPPARGSPAWEEGRRECFGILLGGLKTSKGRSVLPTLSVETMLHAALRWNKTQRLKPNDVFDFGHAAAGLGYCDALFTDGPLASVLTRRDIALDRHFDCTVGSTVNECLGYVQGLLAE